MAQARVAVASEPSATGLQTVELGANSSTTPEAPMVGCETPATSAGQAHGIQDGPIGGNPHFDEGGQLVFLSN